MTDNAALLESMERRAGTTHLMAAYFEGLKSEGYVEGQNVAIEYRWASGVSDRMPAMLADLARLQPDVIVAFGTAARIAWAVMLRQNEYQPRAVAA